MKKVILNVAISLDGLIEGPNGEYDWCFTDQDYGMTEFLNQIDIIFYGRKSYEMMINASEDGKNPFANKRSIVFSRTLTSSDEYTVVNSSIKDEVTKIKGKEGKDIWLFGGAELTKNLLEEDLIDELLLAVHPIVLGKGKPMFNLAKRKSLTLLNVKSYSSGLVSLHYKLV